MCLFAAALVARSTSTFGWSEGSRIVARVHSRCIWLDLQLGLGAAGAIVRVVERRTGRTRNSSSSRSRSRASWINGLVGARRRKGARMSLGMSISMRELFIKVWIVGVSN